MTGHQLMHVAGLVLVALACWVILAIAMTVAWSHAARSHRRRQPAPEFEASAYTAPKPRCAVPFCDDPVTVHKRVGYETWTFCLTHGMPYLGNEVAS